MRIIQNKGPFKTIDVLLEECSADEIQRLTHSYDRVAVLFHHEMDMPGFRLRHKKTPNIYVNMPLEDVFKSFRDTVRNEIHRTERLEGFVVRLPDDNAKEAYGLYRDFEYAQGRVPIAMSEFGRYVLAGAYLNGQLLAGISFYQGEDKIRVRSIFSRRLAAKGSHDQELYKMVGFSSKRLVFEICKYAQSHGAILVDLASINLTDPAKEPIARFKSGFGARIEDEYQYISTSRSFRYMEGVARMKNALLKFARKILSSVR